MANADLDDVQEKVFTRDLWERLDEGIGNWCRRFYWFHITLALSERDDKVVGIDNPK